MEEQSVAAVTLADVRERLKLECALCGRLLRVEEADGHREAHLSAGEGLSWGEFAARCAANVALEGLPGVDAAGSEVVWPFETVTDELRPVAAVALDHALA